MIENKMQYFSKSLRAFIIIFLLVLSVGYFTGMQFVYETSKFSVNGIQQNYLGNESDENAKIMKFKKSKREIITIIHTHILSLSVIFFITGILLFTTNLPVKYKRYLSIEPFISLIITFGGIYFLWTGILWTKYLIAISGFLMTISFAFSVLLLLYYLVRKTPDKLIN